MPSEPSTVRPASRSGPIARLAVVADVAELVRLRAVMFESMGVDASDTEWRVACRAHLDERLGDGRVIGAVVDKPRGGGLAASALAELSARLPGPSRPTSSYAYLSSISTDPVWRRRGMARAAVSLLLDELHRRGVFRTELHATPEGQPLYRSFGFVPRGGETEMRLVL